MKQPIPVNAAMSIAKTYGWDQVVIIARFTGADGLEHVTTYGRNAEHCAIAARIGDFLKFKVMGWLAEDTHEDRRYEALTQAIEKSGSLLALVDAGLTLLAAAVTAEDPKRENLARVEDLQKEVRDVIGRLKAVSS